MLNSRDTRALDETIVCIVDRENITLAAAISSYFSAVGTLCESSLSAPGVELKEPSQVTALGHCSSFRRTREPAPDPGFHSILITRRHHSRHPLGVTVALLTLVLSGAVIGNELGTLSALVSQLHEVAETLQMSAERRRAFKTLLSQYHALWFTVEVLPIPMYFQIALLLAL